MALFFSFVGGGVKDTFQNILWNLKFKTKIKKEAKKVHVQVPIERIPEEVPAQMSFFQSALSFSILLFMLVLPFKAFTYYKALDLDGFKGRILGATEAALEELKTGSKEAFGLNFEGAGSNFTNAGENFLEAQNELEKINNIFFKIAGLIPSDKAKLASESKNILIAAGYASKLGENLTAIANSFFSKKENIFKILEEAGPAGEEAERNYANLRAKLAEINPDALPSNIREEFIVLKEKSLIFERGLLEFVEILKTAKVFLGADEKKRYLLVFQNNNELRASGGFIGSFALVDLNKGKIENLEIPHGGSYDTEGGLSVSVEAPEPLHLVSPLWHFWDANWWPDWPTTAQKLMWFYEKSDGPTVDGVIGITPTVLEKLLKVVGPIDLQAEHGVTIDEENFWITVQSIAEDSKGVLEGNYVVKPEDQKSRESKKIIDDLMNKIVEELPQKLDKDNFIEILKIFEESLSEKHVLFYFSDEQLQKKAENFGWDGRIKDTKWDYLSVINTNIAGGKSDRRIEEEIIHTSEVTSDGSIVNTLEIKRTHTGINREAFCGVRNVDWMRIYVPLGSKLIEAQGFDIPDEVYFEDPEESWEKDSLVERENNYQIYEPSETRIYEEAGKTVFANWSMVDPEESITIYLKYVLPFKVVFEEEKENQVVPHALFVQKQPGAKASKFISNLKLPDNFNVHSKYVGDMQENFDGWTLDDEIDSDKYWAVLLKEN